MLQKRIFDGIKDYLEKKYGLDMFGRDVRFAYLVYYVYMNEFPDIVNMRLLVRGASEFVKEFSTVSAFERSVYMTLKKLNIQDTNYLSFVMNLAKEIQF